VPVTHFSASRVGLNQTVYGYTRRETGEIKTWHSIEGGNSEVMCYILGERVLELPGEPRVDRDIPWREMRCS
jgi:hypothetical protein